MRAFCLQNFNMHGKLTCIYRSQKGDLPKFMAIDGSQTER